MRPMKPNWSGEYGLDRPSSTLSTEDRMAAESVMIMTWRYELSDDGRRLRATERIVGAGRDQDNVWEFERLT